MAAHNIQLRHLIPNYGGTLNVSLGPVARKVLNYGMGGAGAGAGSGGGAGDSYGPDWY